MFKGCRESLGFKGFFDDWRIICTLGLTENTDRGGNKINDFFLPMSLRVKDSSVEKSNDGEIIDFIFSKDASVAKYDILLVEDKDKKIADCIKHLISDSFYYEANE